MKQTQQIKPPITHGSHVDCSASLTKMTALQEPIPIFVCVCTPDLGCTVGNNDIASGTDTDFVGACTPALSQKKKTEKGWVLKGSVSFQEDHSAQVDKAGSVRACSQSGSCRRRSASS